METFEWEKTGNGRSPFCGYRLEGTAAFLRWTGKIVRKRVGLEKIHDLHGFEKILRTGCFSKPKRTLKSDDVIRIYNEKNNHVKIHLFIRKNKEDEASKEFYYLGQIHPIGDPIQMIMPNTTNNVVQFTYRLENEIRKDIFDYITNND